MSFNFAIMGAGSIAGKFVDAVRRVEGCEVVAVASKSMERAEIFARRFVIERYYDSYETMLQEGSIDCVYIATTPNFHYELAKLCLAYNVPVLCEKAMFMNRKEAEDIFAESKRKGVFVMEAMWSRFLPAVHTHPVFSLHRKYTHNRALLRYFPLPVPSHRFPLL